MGNIIVSADNTGLFGNNEHHSAQHTGNKLIDVLCKGTLVLDLE